MKTRDSDHPLAIWLEKHGFTAYQWARENGIGIATVYKIFQGRAPHMNSFMKIEYATCGEVSMRQMYDWYAKNRDAKEAQGK